MRPAIRLDHHRPLRPGVPLMALSVLFLVSCREVPTSLESTAGSARGASAPASASSAPLAAPLLLPVVACTHHWTGAIDDQWDVAGNWSPASVPGSSNVACLDNPGTYTVEATDINVRGLKVGGGSARPTLHFWNNVYQSGFRVADQIVVATNSVLDVERALAFGGANAVITNDGTLTIPNSSDTRYVELVNRGDLEIEPGSHHVSSGGLIENRGSIELTAGINTHAWIYFDGPGQGTFAMEAGSLSGAGVLQIQGPYVGRAVDVVWNGGTISASAADTSRSALLVNKSDLTLGNTALNGRVDFGFGYDTTVVSGSVGPNVRLDIELGWDNEVFSFRRSSGTLSYENEGLMIFGRPPDIRSYTLSFPNLINRGSIDLDGCNICTIEAFLMTNLGDIDVGYSRVRFAGAGNGSVLRNHGTVTVHQSSYSTAALEIAPGAEFLAESGGAMSGRLELDGGTLRGDGSAGDVVSIGGAVKPGAPIGTLTVRSLELDSSSKLEFEIADTIAAANDAMTVTGGVTYGGSLSIVTRPPFGGGRCGQVIPLLTHDPKAGASGQFSKTQGLVRGMLDAWRVDTQSGLLQIAGYARGTGAVAVTSSGMELTEGQPGSGYWMCLGSNEPKSQVEVSTTSSLGRLTGLRPIVWDPSEWRLPRYFAVAVRNDQVAQGPQTDTLTHVVTSSASGYVGVPPIRVPVILIDDDTASDASITKTLQEDNQFVGDSMSTTFRVANAGPFDATGVTVTSTPLNGLGFIGAVGGTCSLGGGGVLTCALGGLATGEDRELVLTFEGLSAGLHTQTLAVSLDQFDPDVADNVVVYTQRIN